MFSINAILYAISSLANLLGAGMSAAEATDEMIHLQPKHAAYWKSARAQCSNGQSLADVLRPILDSATHVAVAAAENSGTLSDVLLSLQDAMKEKLAIRDKMKSMFYPFGMVFIALGVALLFLGFVVPALAGAMPNNGKKSSLNLVADALHVFLTTYYIQLAVSAAFAITAIVFWLRNPENRNTIIAVFDNIPLLGAAARDLYYGEWAIHMSINTHAGITVLDAIQLTYKMMPSYYHPELLAVARDATRIGTAAAASPPPGTNDPRHKIPSLVRHAFRFADKTGVTDRHFFSAGNALIVQGKQRIDLFVSASTNILIPIAASLGAGAILPYFMQIGDSFAKLH